MFQYAGIYASIPPMRVTMMRTVSEFYRGNKTECRTIDQLKRDWRYVVSHPDMWDLESDPDYLSRNGL